MTIGFIFAFITQMALMLYFSREEQTVHTTKTLFWTVLTYSVVLGTVFMLISYYHDGDSFVFCKFDAMFYYTNSIKFAEMGVTDGFKYITQHYHYDDWGALIFDGLLMSIVPSKLFLNAIHMLLGAISSVFLFKIGRYYMSNVYAFLAALGFGTSSFMVFFHCSFLKESVFVFFVIATMYYLFLFITNQHRFAWIAIAFFLLVQIFYRPAVTAMLIISIVSYYGITQRKNAISFFLYIIAAGIFVVVLKDIQEILTSNTQGGDVEALVAETNNSSYSYSFNYFVSLFGAVFGPFPTCFSKDPETPTWIAYYGAGLSYRMFLVFSFWYGAYMIYKNRLIELLPMMMFLLFELLATGLVCASLELRKVILHIPFIYFVAFYGLWSRSKKENTASNFFSFPVLVEYGFIIGVFFLWNVVKV